MSIRSEVSEFVANGPLPGEDAGVQTVARAQALLERIQPPLTDDEAHALAVSFGPDDSYGLGWSLLHLIESAPGARTADYSSAPRSQWTELLQARVTEATKRRRHSPTDAGSALA